MGYSDILDNCGQVGATNIRFLFQCDIAPMHETSSIKKRFGEEERYWLAQNPDLNCIQHLWGELEHRLWARPQRPASVPDLTDAHVAEWGQIQTAGSSAGAKSGACLD